MYCSKHKETVKADDKVHLCEKTCPENCKYLWRRAFDNELPEDDTRVIIWFEHTGMSLSYYKRDVYPKEITGEENVPCDIFYDRGGFLTDEDVYWQPAPEDPFERKEKRMKNKGFTLVELIVVAIIVLVLASIAIPLIDTAVKVDKTISVVNGRIQTTSKEEVVNDAAKMVHEMNQLKKQFQGKLDSLKQIEQDGTFTEIANEASVAVPETVYVKEKSDWTD